MRELWTWFSGQPMQVALIAAAATTSRWLLARLVTRLTNRVVTLKVRGEEHDAGRGERARKRALSITALLNRIVASAIYTIASVMALSVFGINVAPIVASAGLVGVALGFGAQELVRDFIAGIFITIEDQYASGDEVDLGEVRGTVEEVGLRVTRIRAEDGTVWYVRNGQIQRVGNRSQGGAA